MDDALGVGSIQPVGNLNRERQKFVILDRPAGDAMLESLPFQQFHRDERLALVFVNFVDRAYVRMIERRRWTRLAAQAFQRLSVAGRIRGQELEGDEAS